MMLFSNKRFKDIDITIYESGRVCFHLGYNAIEVSPGTARQLAKYLAKRLLKEKAK